MIGLFTDSDFALKELERFKTKFDKVIKEDLDKEIKKATEIIYKFIDLK